MPIPPQKHYYIILYPFSIAAKPNTVIVNSYHLLLLTSLQVNRAVLLCWARLSNPRTVHASTTNRQSWLGAGWSGRASFPCLVIGLLTAGVTGATAN